MKKTSTTDKNLLEIPFENLSHEQSRENILKYLSNPKGNFVIQSVNPEICVQMQSDPEFKKIVLTGQMHIVDGIGVVVAGKVLGITVGERFTGVDLVHTVLTDPSFRSFRVMLIGGKGNVAERLADCYRDKKSGSNVFGFQGIEDISHVTRAEEENLFSIVAELKPQIIFFAFGSPAQEKWIYAHRTQLQGIVCAGVGGAFDFLAGDVGRAPAFVRKMGFEWLYRLILQPWRWRRQLRLGAFVGLVLKEKLHHVFHA